MFRTSALWCVALLIATLLAFWPTYVANPAGFEAFTHVHALAMTLWCALLIVQPLLVRLGRRSAHRTLGTLSYVVAPAVFVTTLLLVHQRMNAATEFVARDFYLPLGFIFVFALAYALAIRYRRPIPVHAGCMLATALTFIDPVVSRILAFYSPLDGEWFPVVTFTLIDVLLLFIVYKARGATRALLPAFALVELGWFTFSGSDAWAGFAAWYRDI